jgi:predicted amidohydrolase
MAAETLAIALVTDVFDGQDAAARLDRRIGDGAGQGAELIVLPELPLNPWSAASQSPIDADAEPPDGPRCRILAEAALAAGVGIIGGAIVRDLTGRRLNTAMVHGPSGELLYTYAKVHLPEEPGYWETSHYAAGTTPPVPVRLPGCDLPLGIQICSDINRPAGAQLLAAQGAELIIVPRATEPGGYRRWRLVFQSVAITNAAWVVSVNRPTDSAVPIGGPSLVVNPAGEVVLETEDPLAVVTIDRAAVTSARASYPGYLLARCEVYADGWRAASGCANV